jgi:predicted nucleotidyltransferase
MTLNRVEQLSYMAKTCDKRLIKGKDLEAFNKIIGYLKHKGLNPQINGSVIENPIYKGMNIEYSDIDILVPTTLQASNGFLKTFNELDSNANLPENMNMISQESGLKYLRTHINQRFELEHIDNNGRNRLVDLCFTNLPN